MKKSDNGETENLTRLQRSMKPREILASAAAVLIIVAALLAGSFLTRAAVILAACALLVYFVLRSRKLYALLESERDSLLASEEQNRIAIAESGINLARYDLKTKTMYVPGGHAVSRGYGERIENMPEELIGAGLVAPDCVGEYREFFEKLRQGENAAAVVSFKEPDGNFRWFSLKASVVLNAQKKPCQAIISFYDVSEQREQEAVYARWQQSMERRDPESFTLFCCNLSKSASFDKTEGELLNIRFNSGLLSFNDRTREYAEQFVHPDELDEYVDFLSTEHLLACYRRGNRAVSMNYREHVSGDEYRTLRVTVEMAQYSDSSDIEAFLLYEKCGGEKDGEADMSEYADIDSLTGVLNRAAFIEKFTELITVRQPQAQHALILVDIDGFNRLNDNFGHTVGDQALIDIAESLRSAVREDDIVGRLGGDEFLVCVKNVPGLAIVEQKAMQIGAMLRKVFSVEIQLSASLGIAVYPSDGGSFDELYYSVDLALYTAKSNGSDSFAFYNGEGSKQKKGDTEAGAEKKATRQRRILVLDDREETPRQISELFDGDYCTEACTSEKDAMSMLHRYGMSVAAVVLRLAMPSVDSMALLDRIRRAGGNRAIPVIVLGTLEGREANLQAIRHGASDFLIEPLDAEILKIRLTSAMSKSENELLRTQNTYLQTQTIDGSQLRTVFENTGTVVVEYDWLSHYFTYDPDISRHIFGRYDERSLWQIFMSDMVADSQDVKAMQKLLYELANDRKRTTATMDIILKTPAKEKHWFTLNAFKRLNEMSLTSKFVLTFLDVNEDILASKKLRFQAEHDSLTGIYNRETFLKSVEKTVKGKQGDSYMLLCCDIDDFRSINERFGREEGDKLLVFAAEKLMAYSDAMNGLAGRLSNDVYAMLLPNDPGIMEKIERLARGFFEGYPLKAKITGRAGAYIILDPDMSADAMLDLASTACATIKGKFASYLAVYDESMNEMRLREKYITDRMESALAQGQFDIYIQPQFNHATGRIVGAEALARWSDPQRGMISPGEFIPIFEKSGFITKLDEFVWERTAFYTSQWLKAGNALVPISVNVSREDVNDPELCGKLLAIVEKYALPKNLFRLEITESLFSEDTDRLIAVVEQLHEAGFLIEMDDFGSGYSSLNILKDVPVDILKLDMKFFSGKDNFGRGGMILNAVMRMARWLKIPVIAEGVELREQADFLMSIGCTTIQGYLYEKPMPRERFEEKFLENLALSAVQGESIESDLEAHSFWDPLSSDSQIFNNYIGPAAIFECFDENYELVRMNKRFISTVQIHELTVLPASGLVHFLEEDLPKFKSAVQKTIASRADVKVEVRCALEDGSSPLFRATLRLLAKRGDHALIFAVLDT